MWWWVLIWVVLVLSGAAYLAVRAWGVWGRLKDLTAELHRATTVVEALQVEADRLGERSPAPQPDVFGDPRLLRKHRDATRAHLKHERRARLAARRPAWAKHLD
jgi:hypothetical protein